MRIARMQKKHVEEVTVVLKEAFSDWALKRNGKAQNRLRNPECFYPYLDNESEGCFVAIDKTRVIGVIFAHTWGKFGWIGTFGILPEYQEKGIGKELMLKAIDYLDKKRNVTTLCLETMPENSVNIGLYSKLGFKPAFLTISLIKKIDITSKKTALMKEFAEANSLEISDFSEEENKEDAFTRMNWLASKIVNGLDHRSEIQIGEEYKFGRTILLKREGFIIGYAICRTSIKYINFQSEPYFEIKNLVIDKDIKDSGILDFLLYTCEQWGLNQEKENARVSINSSYWLAYQHLIKEYGFKVKSTILRMIRYSEDIKAYDHHNEWIVMCNYLRM